MGNMLLVYLFPIEPLLDLIKYVPSSEYGPNVIPCFYRNYVSVW